jgi:hypothetical protein
VPHHELFSDNIMQVPQGPASFRSPVPGTEVEADGTADPNTDTCSWICLVLELGMQSFDLRVSCPPSPIQIMQMNTRIT